jgi:hypothetical protein
MKVADISKAVVPVFALGAALQTFVAIGLMTKLIVILIASVFVLEATTSWLIQWRSPRVKLGNMSSPRKKSLVVAVVIQAIVCVTLGLIGWFVINFYAVNVVVGEDPSRASSEIWVNGSFLPATKVIIKMPRQSVARCTPTPNGLDPHRVASSTVYDWNSANPQLHITDLRYPQRQGVVCEPRISLGQLIVRIEPTSLDLLLPDDRRSYVLVILILGGILWLLSSALIHYRTR